MAHGQLAPLKHRTTNGNADRFDYVDVNGNGVIERNEWDGGYDAFDRLDTHEGRQAHQS